MVDNGMIAIIGIAVALVVCIIALIIFLIIFCRMKIRDDTNIRRRVLSRKSGGFAQEEVKQTEIIEEEIPAPRPYIPAPAPRREIVQIQEPLPRPPSPPPQPEIVVHEVVHRYEPTAPQVLPPPPPMAPPPQRLVRRSSWSEGHGHHHHHHNHNDEWVMIKKKKKRAAKARVEDDSSSSEDEDCHGQCGHGHHHHHHQCMTPRLNHYDLAIPVAYQQRPAAIATTGVGMGMGAATYMVGARPAVPTTAVYGIAPAGQMMTSAATFQPTYGMLPRL